MTYEYACSACGHEWEAEQKISEDPIRKCPKCKQSKAKRQISRGAGFILKGGGWYADGYGSSGGSSPSTASTSSSSSSDSKAESASDAKSDSKAGSSSDSKGKTAAA